MIPFEIGLAWRYIHSRRKHPFIGLISKISIAGVAIGVAALVIVISVMTGFEQDLMTRVIGTYAHMTIEADQPFDPTEPKIRKLYERLSPSASWSEVYQGQALIRTKVAAKGVLIRGMSKEHAFATSSVEEYILEGSYPTLQANEILIGQPLAQILQTRIGDEIEFFSVHSQKGRKLKVSGFYKSGMYEYDSTLIYADLQTASQLFAAPGKINQIALKFEDPATALVLQEQVQKIVGYYFFVRSWKDFNRSLFDAIRLEKTVMFIILSLIITVACFNIIGTLTMTVMDRTREIGVMRALGASRFSVGTIFFLIGIYTGVLGTFFGFGIGYAVCDFLKRNTIIDIPSDVYYFDYLPVVFDLQDATYIVVCAIILTAISAIYPALWASKRPIVESLRYE